MSNKDPRIAQVERILAMMLNATYPGEGAWRFRITCKMIERGATAEAERGDNDLCGSHWLAAAISILQMNPKHGLYDWNSFSPKEMTDAAKEFLPAAQALLLWIDAIRKKDAEDQECDYKSIGFMPEHPAYIIMDKLDNDDSGPNEELIKRLLFTEDRFCNKTYNPLLFEQLDHTMGVSGEDIDYEEPFDEADIVECSTIAEALWEDRAEREGRQDDPMPPLNEDTIQSMIECLSAPNDEFLKEEKARNDAARARMSKILDDHFSALHEKKEITAVPEEHKDTLDEIKASIGAASTAVIPFERVPFLNGKVFNFLIVCHHLPERREAIGYLQSFCDEQARNALALKSEASKLWMDVRTAIGKENWHHPFVTEEDLSKSLQAVAEMATVAADKLTQDARLVELQGFNVAKLIHKFRNNRPARQNASPCENLPPGRQLSEMQLKQIQSGETFYRSMKKKSFAGAAKHALTYEQTLCDAGNTATDGYLGKAKGDTAKAIENLSQALSRRKRKAQKKS